MADRRAYQAAWYLAHKKEHNARSRTYYEKNRKEIRARHAAYERTAQGMLARVRTRAKERRG